MRYFFPVIFLLFAAQNVTHAQRWVKTPDDKEWREIKKVAQKSEPIPEHTPYFGFSLNVGFPDGIAPSIELMPGTSKLRFDFGPAGLVSFGVRGGLTIDPFDSVVAPTLSVAGGHYFWGESPTTRDRFSVDYLTAQLGIEIGQPQKFRAFVRGGIALIWVHTDDTITKRFQDTVAVHFTEPITALIHSPAITIGMSRFF